jgi:hypothetical protein
MSASALRSHTNFPLNLAGWAVKAWGQDLVRKLKLKVYRHGIGFNPERLCKGMGCGLESGRKRTAFAARNVIPGYLLTAGNHFAVPF